ncbi:MAG TPA: hypothetical protein VJ144_10390, partial [Candidatus Polarisedimenticolia bacterium]|nr:hypothetical protein [Candidatus Polarisedimenticolia bacterium]
DRYPRCAGLAEELKAAVAEWKQASDPSAPRTLVSGKEGEARAPAPAPEAGVRGITFLAPRWASLLSQAGTRLGAGWIAFLLCLALLASAPYFLSRPPSAAASGRPLVLVTAPWSSDGGAKAEAAPPAPGPAEAARLTLSLQHRFSGGKVVVRIDGTEVLAEPIRGGGKKRWTRSITVVPGRRRIEVRVTSGDRTLDDIQGIEAAFRPKEKKTLLMTVGALSKRLKLRFDEPATVRAR